MSEKHRSRSDETIGEDKKEIIGKFLKKGMQDAQVLAELNSKYKDTEVVKTLFDAYKVRQERLQRRALRLKNALVSHYSQLSLSELIKKAEKIKKKKKYTDDEFDAFMKMLLTDSRYAKESYHIPAGQMSATLGYYGPASFFGERLHVKTGEFDVLQEILQMGASTKILHDNVVIQSLQYTDCAPSSLMGKFDRNKHNAYSFIHPVLAALFIPKIKLVDEHMLIASIPNIIKSKYESIPITNQPEMELYIDINVDPNNELTQQDPPLVSLRNRAFAQLKLWENVINLRQGNYYYPKSGEFLMALDKCHSNIFDAPDLSYVRDEGMILRKLLGVFSMRPTIVSVAPYHSMQYGVSFGHEALMGIDNTMPFIKVSSIPIITIKLPDPNSEMSIDLRQSLNQLHWFSEHGKIMPKKFSILYSNNILMFYANRRTGTQFNTASLRYPQLMFSQGIPASFSNWQMINNSPVNYEQEFKINNDTFALRSVVFVETSAVHKGLIIGNSAGIRSDPNPERGEYERHCYLYDPQSASLFMQPQSEESGKYVLNDPVTEIEEFSITSGAMAETFEERARKSGTIYIYAKKTERGESITQIRGVSY